jgi:hypothetical protein
MRISRRSLAPGDADHELIWLIVSISSLVCAAIWFYLGLPWPRCAFHDFTGLPCLTCGMTRCAIQFFHGHVVAAWTWNPLVFAFLSGVAVFDLYAFAVVITRSPRLRIRFSTRSEKNWTRFIAIAVLGLNWIYLLSQWRQF